MNILLLRVHVCALTILLSSILAILAILYKALKLTDGKLQMFTLGKLLIQAFEMYM